MRRVIYSFYIDLEEGQLVSHHDSKKLFYDNYDWLLTKQQQYARTIGVDYIHYTADQAYKDYSKWFETNYPTISHYDIVNFYKIHLMYKLAKHYDQILYLDMDVIPVTDISFFEAWNLAEGIAIKTGSDNPGDNPRTTFKFNHHVRSPVAKYWHSRCMLTDAGYSVTPEVFNTGIVGTTSQSLKQLDYFSDFDSTLDVMKSMPNDDFYPEKIRKLFGYDNETLWAYKTYVNEVPFQKLDDDWHYFMYRWSYVPPSAKFVHCVSKDFKYVRDWCEKNNI